MAQLNETNEYSQTLLFWVQSQLNVLIGADDFAPLLLSLDDDELQTYCLNLLGTNEQSLSFVNELIIKRNDEIRQKQQSKQSQKQKQSKRANRRNKKNKNNKNNNSSMKLNSSSDGPSVALQKKYDALKSHKNNKQNNNNKMPLTSTYRQGGAMTINYAPISKSKKSQTKKRKERQRKMCGCQATLHDVFKNCTECGNILCMIEGEGPCFFCSAYVTLAGTVSSINSDVITHNNENSEVYKKAVAQKDKLLRFGREKIAQTTIIDDQGDFYESEANNLWLSQRERDIARLKAEEEEKKLNESRADKAMEISINIGTNGNVSIIEERDERKSYAFASIDREKELKEKLAKNKQQMIENEANKVSNSWYHNSSLTGHASKVYASLQKMINSEKEKMEKIKEKKKENVKEDAMDSIKNKFIREANDDFEDENEEKMEKDVSFLSKKGQSKNLRKKLRKKSKFSNKSDEGVCLSMHQPWASLLVLGIKQVEGRSWSTAYRGRLWIASARREPTPFEIEEVESEYCKVYGLKREQIPFPTEYPTTALLGCVDMIDCLSNEEYQKQFIQSGLSTENNGSAHCFLCENPRRLILPGAISGEHKLWKMPIERIKPMQSGLVPCDLSWISNIEDRKKGMSVIEEEEVDEKKENDNDMQRWD